jgi:hypothetical protein
LIKRIIPMWIWHNKMSIKSATDLKKKKRWGREMRRIENNRGLQF